MKKLIIASVLSLLIPLSLSVSAEETGGAKKLKDGFVEVDLMEIYQIDLTHDSKKKSETAESDQKVLFFDVDIMKLKLNYDFENTESALKNIKPK